MSGCCDDFVPPSAGEGSGGGGGSSSDTSAADVLTFRPGSADVGPVVFNTWAALYARLVTLRDNATVDTSGRFTIVFDGSLGACVIPSDGGTYDMTATEWLAATWEGPDRTDLIVGDNVGADVAINNLLLITGLSITSTQPGAPPIATVSTIALTLVNTAIDASNGGTETVIAANFTTIRLGDESQLLGRAGTPAIALSGNNQLTILVNGANAEIGTDSISSVGASDVVFVDMQSSSGQVSLTQANLFNALLWSDDTTAATSKIINRSGPSLPPHVGGATPVDLTNYGSIGYTIEVTGATPTVLLPSCATFQKGELIAVKRVDTQVDASLMITLTPSGVEEIDNLASYTFSGTTAWIILQARGADAAGGWSGWNVLSKGPNVQSAVSTFTLGSVPFADATGLLTQDNARFFWDAASHRLGINTNVPGEALHVVGNAHITGKLTVDGAIDPTSLTLVAAGNLAYLENANGVSAAVSPANRGRLVYNATAQKWQVSENGVAYASLVSGTAMAIGGTVTGATVGSVLFAATGPVLAQDNATFFWDTTNKRLGLGTTGPAVALDARANNSGGGIIQVVNTNTAGYSEVLFHKSDNTQQLALGYGNATVGIAYLQGKNFLYSTNATDIVLANASKAEITFGMTDAQIQMEMAAGTAVSHTNTGALAYSTGIQRFVMQTNAGVAPGTSSKEIALWTAARSSLALTSGVIPFTDTDYNLNFYDTGATTSDDALMWDNTNKRMGVGTPVPNTWSPTTRLVVRSKAGEAAMQVVAAGTTSYAAIDFTRDDNSERGSVGYGGTATGGTLAGMNFFFAAGGQDWVMSDSTTTWYRWYNTTNSVGFELANGSGGAAALANTGKLRYNTTGQKFQVSANTGSYFDVATYAAALTTGSVLFANASNQILQDNANFFWDDSNNRLGIGNAAPATTLHVTGTIRATVGLTLDFLTATNVPFAGAAGVISQNNAFNYDDSIGILQVTKGVQFPAASGTTVSAASTARIKYDEGTNKIRVSLNGAAYVDIVTL